eukprot:scaffold26_cov397-Pavlova_lutheri.AAC.5
MVKDINKVTLHTRINQTEAWLEERISFHKGTIGGKEPKGAMNRQVSQCIHTHHACVCMKQECKRRRDPAIGSRYTTFILSDGPRKMEA